MCIINAILIFLILIYKNKGYTRISPASRCNLIWKELVFKYFLKIALLFTKPFQSVANIIGMIIMCSRPGGSPYSRTAFTAGQAVPFCLLTVNCHVLKYVTTSICIIISIHHPENLNFCHFAWHLAAHGISAKWSREKWHSNDACVSVCVCVFVFIQSESLKATEPEK